MFDNNGSGTISLAGMLTMGTSHYRVLRTAIMQYQTIDVENGLFNLSHTGDAIQDYDNAPKDVIDTYLLRGTDGKTKRVFRAMPLNDHAYLVGNAYSPVMVCSKVNG
ncbi:FidL-like protein [Pragia fontium]|nr:FidL-like protein [Pragia fontium]